VSGGGATGKGKLFRIPLPQRIIAPMRQGQKTTVKEVATPSTPEQ